jgi:adenylate kinase family enzyme
MKKIMLIGCGGTGKSTLAPKIGDILELPIYHLDRLHWHPNWIPTPSDEWRTIQENIVSQPKWIIDGNYGGTMDVRMGACDAVIFLDLPRWRCFYGIFKRFLTYRGKSRPDMTEGCEERITMEFLRWIWNYSKTRRPGILEKLEGLKNEKRVFILQTRKEVNRFLASLQTNGK